MRKKYYLLNFATISVSFLLTVAAVAQTGRFGSAGTPNLGPPEAALFPNLAAQQDKLEEEGWIVRGQATFVLQGHPTFRSPYRGDSSLAPSANARNTFSSDLILGRTLWDGAEVVVNPSITRGFGLSNSVGLAAFPNNEAFRLGSTEPYLYVPRFFFRQTIGLSADTVPSDDDPLRFSQPLPRERVTITAGKISTFDIFDDNRYAHDPRTQFLNWALVAGSAVDYAADARGYTNGVALEWENSTWAVRSGAFQVARRANGLFMDPSITRGYQLLSSVERFWQINGREGAIRFIGGLTSARQSSWSDLFINGFDTFEKNPNRYRRKLSGGISFDQQITPEFGVFARFSMQDSRIQSWMFTEHDQAISAGASLRGTRWGREGDTLAVATNLGFASNGRRRYLDAGGIGFIVGDGRLNYRPELVTETYYDVRISPGINMALNYQMALNPGFNADRGPVHLFALRARTAF
ncbi:carbohydrate porin [Paeniroseomonas aquatica]|uniref:Carbohydrate porin n=2 Tax=Paeniroseomonas aquatica TaxID=373043 RepID=A0ABT7ZZD7_9PROT|nr:carbohydrate porin [Paeniroseomonas aquatica]MDN3562838.1 carbohydrate porin [Paeniroseomonas aquatica]